MCRFCGRALLLLLLGFTLIWLTGLVFIYPSLLLGQFCVDTYQAVAFCRPREFVVTLTHATFVFNLFHHTASVIIPKCYETPSRFLQLKTMKRVHSFHVQRMMWYLCTLHWLSVQNWKCWVAKLSFSCGEYKRLLSLFNNVYVNIHASVLVCSEFASFCWVVSEYVYVMCVHVCMFVCLGVLVIRNKMHVFKWTCYWECELWCGHHQCYRNLLYGH